MATPNSKKLSFYDVGAKKKFVPKNYTVKKKGDLKYALATNPKTGNKASRILGGSSKKKK